MSSMTIVVAGTHTHTHTFIRTTVLHYYIHLTPRTLRVRLANLEGCLVLPQVVLSFPEFVVFVAS